MHQLTSDFLPLCSVATDKGKLRTSSKIRIEKNLTADSYVPAAYLPAHVPGEVVEEFEQDDSHLSKLTTHELATESKRERVQREMIEDLRREVTLPTPCSPPVRIGATNATYTRFGCRWARLRSCCLVNARAACHLVEAWTTSAPPPLAWRSRPHWVSQHP